MVNEIEINVSKRAFFLVVRARFCDDIRQRGTSIGKISLRLRVSIRCDRFSTFFFSFFSFFFSFFLSTYTVQSTHELSVYASFAHVSLSLCTRVANTYDTRAYAMRASVLSLLISPFSSVSRFAFHRYRLAITSTAITNIT